MTRYAHLVELDEIQGRYRDKRSVAYRLLGEVLEVARSAVAEAEGRADGRIVEVERYHQSTKDLADVLRRRVAQLEDQRRLVDDRFEHGPDAAQVSIRHALNDGQGWTVAELEEVAYRVRTGGGTDETRVKVTDSHAVAVVPAPYMVDLSIGPSRPAGLPDPVVPDHGPRRSVLAWIPFPSTGAGFVGLWACGMFTVALLRVVGVLG